MGDRGNVIFNGKTYSNIRYSDEAAVELPAVVAGGAFAFGVAIEAPAAVAEGAGAVDSELAVEGAGAAAAVGEAGFVAGGAGRVDAELAIEGEEAIAGGAGFVAGAGGALAAGADGIANVVPVVGNGVTLGTPNERALVRMWLLTHLPNLNEGDITHYSRSLIDMGFYSQDMLAVIMPADLGFMRPAHRRFMERRMNGGDPNHAIKIE